MADLQPTDSLERKTMHLNELINPASMLHAHAMGMVRVQNHPTLPLDIYNYTEKAQFAKHWTKATLNCRGLIVHRETKQVMARPFAKFFNWDEKHKGIQRIDLDEPVSVLDKIDGSLGILYPTGLWSSPQKGAHMIATRGSFASDQAQHASAVWIDRYAEEVADRLDPALTYLFEIVYPENRIVVDYKGMDDLVLLGAVHIGTGFTWGPEIIPAWPGPRARSYGFTTLREAVHSRPRPGKEGFVVRSLDNQVMVKVKYEDYVSLHRVVTGLNEKEIWRRAMKADVENVPEVDKLDLVMRDIPDELHEWVSDVVRKLVFEFREKEDHLLRVWHYRPNGPQFHESEREYRGRCARFFREHEKWLQKALWIRYDGNDPREFLWKTIEPKGDVKK